MGILSKIFKLKMETLTSDKSFSRQEYCNDENSITSYFISNFTNMSATLATSPFSKEPIMGELFVAMIATLDFVSVHYDINIDDDRNKIIKWFLTPFLNNSQKELKIITQKIDERLNFYKERSTSGIIRGDFLTEEIPLAFRNWPPYRYGVIFCDCIYNPMCIKDYDNASIELKDVYNSSIQQISLASIQQMFDDYAKGMKHFASWSF